MSLWGLVGAVGGGLLGGPAGAALGGSLGGSIDQSSAAKGAAADQRAATDAALNEQRRQFDLTRGDFAPFQQVGLNALQQLTGQPARTFSNFDVNTYLRDNPDVAADPYFRNNAFEHFQKYGQGEGRAFSFNQAGMDALHQDFDAQAYLRANPDVAAAGVDPWTHYVQFGRKEGRSFTGFGGELNKQVTPQEVMQDPGYQFGLQQGQQALDRKIAAMGGRVSGASLKAATRFGTDYASTGYNAAYQRKQDRLNRLQQLAGVGQTATGSSATAGSQATNAISGLISNQGDASAAGRLAQGNIWGNAGNQIAALYGRQAQQSPWANPSMFSNRGGSFGTSGLDNFFYGNGTGGD